jgi:acetate kinase
MRVLTINSGSSSIKFSVYDFDGPAREVRACSGAAARIGREESTLTTRVGHGAPPVTEQLPLPDHEAALGAITRWIAAHADGRAPDAIGHRIVHGGSRYESPQTITPAVLATLEALVPLAPGHLPHEIGAVRAMMRRYPDTPHVACFDTAFHRRMPFRAQRYALPPALWEAGIRRYGFHGLSYEYIVGELAARRALGARTIVAHLGNGASMAAVHQGASIDTTMGFTPTSGLVMSTRTGDLDPNVVLYLQRAEGWTLDAVDELVNRQGGLLAVSGFSGDMQDLLARERTDERAAEAITLFCYRARRAVGALAAALGGVDTLVFTAGIGEHAPAIRWRICEALGFLGITLDPARNAADAPIISRGDAPVTVHVMRTDEERMIARHTCRLLTAQRAPA